jgi:hypothetical protein
VTQYQIAVSDHFSASNFYGKIPRSRSRACHLACWIEGQARGQSRERSPHQWTGRVSFATSLAPRLPLAELVSNPTPPGQISREWMSWVYFRDGRVSGDRENLKDLNE